MAGAAAPALARRMASFIYDGVLLLGVVALVGFLFTGLVRQGLLPADPRGLRVLLFVALGLYFVGLWAHSGQTLAMKTWRVRLVTSDGAPVSPARALARYLASWVWCLPALAAVAWAGAHGWLPAAAALATNVVAVILLARLHPARQYPHDLLCGTRLVLVPSPTEAAR